MNITLSVIGFLLTLVGGVRVVFSFIFKIGYEEKLKTRDLLGFPCSTSSQLKEMKLLTIHIVAIFVIMTLILLGL